MAIPLPALSVQTPQPENPLEQYSRALQIKSLLQNQQLQGQKIQQNQNLLDRYKAVQSANGDVDAISKIDPELGLKLKTEQQQYQNADLEGKQKILGLHIARTQRAAQLASGVTDQASLEAAVGQAVKEGDLEPQEGQQIIAQGYSPELVQHIQQRALTAAESLKQTQAQLAQQEAVRHDKAMETPTSAREYQFAQQNPEYQQFLRQQKSKLLTPEEEAQQVRLAGAKSAAQEKSQMDALTGAGGTGPGNLVDQIGTGHMAIDRLPYLLARNPALLQAVAAKYPDFDSSKVRSYVDAYKDFTSGPTSKQLNAGAVSLQHLKQLKDINDANPTEVRIPGTAANKAYNNLLDTVADELMTFYGEPKTNEARNSKLKTLGGFLNRDAAIQEQATAMGVRLDELEQRWKNAAPSAAYQAPMPGISASAMNARAALDPSYKQRGTTTQGSTGTVKMQAPNGQTRDVSADQVEHYKSLGAKVVQ